MMLIILFQYFTR